MEKVSDANIQLGLHRRCYVHGHRRCYLWPGVWITYDYLDLGKPLSPFIRAWIRPNANWL